MAVTPTPKTQVHDGKFKKFTPSEDQQIFLNTYGKQDGRDCERLKQAIKLAFATNISWRQAFFNLINAER